ncbi:MAG: T9SS type A sorting domain-containing protein [Saprospiraceae bacterium]|nr:T9SS type A sorting domain-containing protein [Saprospiraceae bacterium]
MKKTHVLLLFTFFYHMASAQINVTYAMANDSRLSQIIKQSNGNYLIVINDINKIQRPFIVNAKILEINSRGNFIDSLIFASKGSNLNSYIDRLIPFSDGYIGLGQITNRLDSRVSFWVFRLNQKLQLIQDTLVPLARSMTAPAFAFDRDSNIIFSSGNLSVPIYFGKIDKKGNVFSWKVDSSEFLIPSSSLIVRKDSLLYTVFTDKEFITFDTAFNKIHKTPIVFSAGFNATVTPLNDSTFSIAGRTTLTSLYGWRQFFGITTVSGRIIFRNIYSTSVDTAIWGAFNYGADSTKQSEWYWGGTYNYILGSDGRAPVASSFILHKLNRDYSIKWTKRYGGDAYYEMYGVLTTDDGGCIMYGTRYDYNSVPKYDAYILKVNGEGLITSESSIPLSINNLHIYPNPSSGLVNFDYKEPLKDVQIRVIDTKGSLVHQVKIAEGLLPTLDLSFLNKGVYFIQIMEQNRLFAMTKWVKSE